MQSGTKNPCTNHSQTADCEDDYTDISGKVVEAWPEKFPGEEFTEDWKHLIDNLIVKLREYYNLKLLDKTMQEKEQLLLKQCEYIDYSILDLFEHPNTTLSLLNLVCSHVAHSILRSIDPSKRDIIEKIVRLNNYFNPLRLKDLKSNKVGEMVTVRGTIVRTSTIKPIVVKMVHDCTCGQAVTTVLQNGKFKVPKCPRRGCKSKMLAPNRSKSITIDFQKVKIQEKLSNDSIDSGRVPRTVDCEVTADLVDLMVPGDVVSCTGIVKVLGNEGLKSEAQLYHLYIDVNNIDKVSSPDSSDECNDFISKDLMDYTKKDLDGIMEMHNYGNLFNLLVHSICPGIFGHELVKAGILLVLFGGRRRDGINSQLHIRPDPHLLVVGDPGLGKSQLLSAAVKLAPRGVYVTGNTSTKAGLTVTVSKDPESGETALEAGALVLGDQGVCCIDEFDKMQDYHSLLEALEQQSVSIAKAGILCTLPTRTSVIAAANPVGGHYNRAKSVAENVKLNSPLLSRFDLIFILLDKPNAEHDRFLSNHILNIHTGGREFRRTIPNNGSQGSSLMSNLKNVPPVSDIVPPSLMRKYISYARTQCSPKLSLEASDIIKEFYLELRSQNRNDGTPITTRQLESLLRLCEARAKCELRDVVTMADARDVVEIMKSSLNDVLDNGTELEFSRSQMGTGNSRQKESKLLAAYLERLKETSGTKEWSLDDMKQHCAGKLYAVQLAVKNGVKSKEAQAFLLTLMDSLEKEKLELAENEAISDQFVGYSYVENFALRIFLKADNEDRQGEGTDKTARAFWAASLFLEVLKVFEGELDADIQQKIKYSKVKVKDIMNAIKRGEKPTPGPPVGDQTNSGGSSPILGNEQPSAGSQPKISNINPPTGDSVSFPTTPTKVPILPTAIPVAKISQPTKPTIPDLSLIPDSDDDETYNEQERRDILHASKLARFSQSALQYDDVKTAIQNLEEALRLLKSVRQFDHPE